jgi:uncharacterized protein (TIGR03435 family)
MIFGMAAGILAAASSFEVASIKPSLPGTRAEIASLPGGRFVANGVRLTLMIAAAYRVGDYQIIGAPGWAGKDQWSIAAKTAEGTVDPPSKAPAYLNVSDAMAARLRSLLEDRCELKTHRETREMQVYTLTVSKSGSKLAPVDAPPETAPGATRAGAGIILASAISMNQIVILLGRLLDRPLIDKTGLNGYFNVKLQFDPESAPRAAFGAAPASASPALAAPSEPAGPSLFTAIQEQLGLKLDLKKEPVEVLVIDSVRKPTEN